MFKQNRRKLLILAAIVALTFILAIYIFYSYTAFYIQILPLIKKFSRSGTLNFTATAILPKNN